MLRTVSATRYITPLREGGSLPAIVEADDGQLYVLKFRGAGQGPKALIAELVAGEIGRALGLAVPELVFVEFDAALARSEPDPEIQQLLSASVGLNLALAYLPNALAFDPAVERVDAHLASQIVWFDAYVTNVDRTARNTNMLIVNRQLWLIDHGASLFFHHTWTDYMTRSSSRFPQIRDHVLLPFASQIDVVDQPLRAQLTDQIIASIVALIPGEWLDPEPQFADHAAHRAAYVAYLISRRDQAATFVEEAINARAKLV